MDYQRLDEALQACRDAIVALLQRVCRRLGSAEVDDVIRATMTRARKELRRAPDFEPACGWPQWLMNRALEDGLYREYGKPLVGYLRCVFPSVRQVDLEDIVQFVFLKDVVERLQQAPDFEPRKDWLAWLRWKSTCRMRDFLRIRYEKAWIEAISKQPVADADAPRPPEPADSIKTPSQLLMEKEKRDRRQILLGEMLATYCRQCEEDCQDLARKEPKDWKKAVAARWEEREVFERSLRQQETRDIASAMGIREQRVYELRVSVRRKLRAIVGEADPRGSLFGTAMFALRDDRRRGRHKAPEREQQVLDLLRRIVDETGALCPSHEILEVCAASHGAASSHAAGYHVNEAIWHFDEARQEPGCPACRRHLDFLGGQLSTT